MRAVRRTATLLVGLFFASFIALAVGMSGANAATVSATPAKAPASAGYSAPAGIACKPPTKRCPKTTYQTSYRTVVKKTYRHGKVVKVVTKKFKVVKKTWYTPHKKHHGYWYCQKHVKVTKTLVWKKVWKAPKHKRPHHGDHKHPKPAPTPAVNAAA